MAEVNLDFSVSTNNLTITPNSTELAFTPNSTQLNIYTGYTTFAPGSSGQVLINTGGIVNAASAMTYNTSTNTVTVENLTVTVNSVLGAIGNVKITGGTNGQFIKTDGTGNLSFGSISPGGSNTQLQYNNNGVFGSVPFLTFNGSNLSLGGVENVKMTGGTNGYVLQTDGTGNLTWTAQTGGGGGNGSPGGSNTQVQFNDAGSFGGDAGFTYNKSTDTLSVNTLSGVTISGVSISASSFTYPNGSPITTSPAGSNTQIQFNDNDVFGASANLNFNNTTNTLSAGNFITSNANITLANITTLASGNANITGYANITGNVTIGGITSIKPAKELITVYSLSPGGPINYDLLTQAVVLTPSAYPSTSNFTFNMRGNSSTTLNNVMSVGQSMTCTFINYNTYPAYYATAMSIDGTTQSVKWLGGAPTTGVANSYQTYNFNIMKTAANTYTVLATSGSYT